MTMTASDNKQREEEAMVKVAEFVEKMNVDDKENLLCLEEAT